MHLDPMYDPLYSPTKKSTALYSITGRQWFFSDILERHQQHLEQHFGLSAFIARILAHRQQSIDEAALFLHATLKDHLPNPHALPDMEMGVARIVRSLKEHEKIAIWGDYDVDGATSSALLLHFFNALNHHAQVHIPDRFKEGYGLNVEGLQSLQASGVRVVIAVDCGTTSFEALDAAAKMGLDVIVIDHHSAEAKLPACVALINPKRIDTTGAWEIFQNLAAVGLTFLFLVALNRSLRTEGFYSITPEPSLIDLLDLVALGTVCDVMPLLGLNRLFVTQGLKIMARRKNLGLKHLQDVSCLKEAPRAYHMGFLLGPRINAGGRVGESSLGVRLLTTQNPLEAESIAQKLNQLNQERQKIEANLLDHAMKQAERQLADPNPPHVLIVSGNGWHEGVIGIIAGRLKDHFHLPTFVISFTDGIGKGSARSIGPLNISLLIHHAVHEAHLTAGGGHAMAGGFSLREDQLLAFKVFVQQFTQDFFRKNPYVPAISVEQWMSFQALTQENIQSLKILEPYGMGNPQPRFAFADVHLKNISWIGQTAHARLTLSQIDGKTVQGVAFRCKEKPIGDFLFSKPAGLFDIVATIGLETWNNKMTPQLILEDIRGM